MITDKERLDWAHDRLLKALHLAEHDRTDEALILTVFARMAQYEDARAAPARTKERLRCERIAAGKKAAHAAGLVREKARYQQKYASVLAGIP